MGKKPKPQEAPKRMTQQEYVASLVPGTEPGDWKAISTGTILHRKGYRWKNSKTGQLAKRATA